MRVYADTPRVPTGALDDGAAPGSLAAEGRTLVAVEGAPADGRLGGACAIAAATSIVHVHRNFMRSSVHFRRAEQHGLSAVGKRYTEETEL